MNIHNLSPFSDTGVIYAFDFSQHITKKKQKKMVEKEKNEIPNLC